MYDEVIIEVKGWEWAVETMGREVKKDVSTYSDPLAHSCLQVDLYACVCAFAPENYVCVENTVYCFIKSQ